MPMENIARSLAVALGERDSGTLMHSDRVVRLSAEMGSHLKLSAQDLDVLAMGAQFHDVGKIGIPDEILRKRGKLTPEEFAIMKTHVNIGASILSHDPSLAIAREVALSHHERWDGGGYPTGQSSINTPLLTRIVSVVDVFDALVSRRPYKDAWSVADAAANIEAAAGGQFDPMVVAAFLKLLRQDAFADLLAMVHADNQSPAGH